jgi:hypothetical protein
MPSVTLAYVCKEEFLRSTPECRYSIESALNVHAVGLCIMVQTCKDTIGREIVCAYPSAHG